MSEEKNYNCLLPQTKNLLLEIVQDCSFIDQYVFVGGSALSLYLCHRKSEDLDFFTFSKEGFNKPAILRYIGNFEEKEILNESDTQIDLIINKVKVTFFDAGWEFLRPKVQDRFNLAPLEAIVAMKVNTLFLGAKYRDYYDIYYLSKIFALRDIFELSKPMVPGLTYKLFCVALLYIDDITDEDIDHLQPEEHIKMTEIRAIFEQKLRLER